MATYYVSNSGNDTNDGITKTIPLKTINRVNQILNAGDTVLFKAGETFYGNITTTAGTALRKTVFSSYDGASKYTISTYKKVVPAAWSNVSPNVYRVAINDNSNFTGNTFDTQTDVGHLFINRSEIEGEKKFSLAELTSNFQFYSDSTYLYLYLTTNPANSGIEFATQERIVRMPIGREVYNAILEGGGRHAMDLFGGNNKVINTTIRNIGGCTIMINGVPSCLGNGIELYGGVSNVEIFGVEVSETYDVAFTLQGESSTPFRNISFSESKIFNCSQSLEFWMRDQGGVPAGGFYDVLIENNECYNTGEGWGAKVRPDLNRVHLLFYSILTNQVDITFRNNTFFYPEDGLYSSNQNPLAPFKSENNTVVLKDGQKILLNDTVAVENFNIFVTQRGKEVLTSRFNLTENPSDIEEIVKNILAETGALDRRVSSIRESIANVKSKLEQQTASVIQQINDLTTGNTVTGVVGDAGYWSKVATYNLSNSRNNQDFSVILAFNTQAVASASAPQSAILSITGKQTTSPTITNLLANVLSIDSPPGSTPMLTVDGFKVLSTGYGNDIEVWVRKNVESGRVNVTELSRGLYDFVNVTYIKNATWQATEPTATYQATSQPASRVSIISITDTTYSLKLSDYGVNGEALVFLNTNSANTTVNLLPVAQSRGLKTTFIKRGGGNFSASIVPNGAEVINEVNAPIVLNQKFTTAILYSSGSQYFNVTLQRLAVNTSATPLSKTTLNTTYPNAFEGFTVVADTAGFTYIKKDNSPTGNWSSHASTLVA